MHLIWILAAQGTAPGWYNLMPIPIILVVFYFLLMRPQIKEQKKHQELISGIKKGDKVVTNGGIWGEVDAVENNVVRLRVAEKTKIMVSRSHIAGLQPKPGETVEKK